MTATPHETPTKVLTSAEKRAQVAELMAEFETAMLVSVGDRELRGRPLHIVQRDEDATVWFVTARDSEKVDEIAADPSVAVIMQAGTKQLALAGRASLVDEPETIAAMWKESWRVWFPDGPEDPNIVLLRVKPTSAEYWDQRGLKGVRYLIDAAKAFVRGTTPTPDEEIHERVTLGRKPAAKKK